MMPIALPVSRCHLLGGHQQQLQQIETVSAGTRNLARVVPKSNLSNCHRFEILESRKSRAGQIRSIGVP